MLRQKTRSDPTKSISTSLDTNLDPLSSEPELAPVDPVIVEPDPLAGGDTTVETDLAPVEPLSVSTDKPDYAPGETALFTVTGVTEGGTVTFGVADDPADPGDDGDADIYPSFAIVDGGEGDLDGEANGSITAAWLVPTNGDPLNATLNLTATDWGADGLLGGEDDRTATTTFTDANPEVVGWENLSDDWKNQLSPSGGNPPTSGARYFEDNSIPFRYTQAETLMEGVTYQLTIQWTYNDGDAYFIDYLTSYDSSESVVPPLFPFPLGNETTKDIPPDPGLEPQVTQQPGEFTLYNIKNELVTDVSFSAYGPGDAAGTRSITITFMPDDGDGVVDTDPIDVGIAWGGHLATQIDYGSGNGAGAFPGGSPKMQISLTGSSPWDQVGINPSGVLAFPSGYKWDDANRDGNWDEAEDGLNGRTIVLDNDQNRDNGNIATVETDDDIDGNAGFYAFRDLSLDDLGGATILYVYEDLPDGAEQTFPFPVLEYQWDITNQNNPELIAGQYGAGAEADPVLSKGNFGNATKIEISGYKWDDVNGDTNWDEPTEAGLNGWTIILDDDENPTNGTIKTATTQTLGMNDGYYTFGDISLADIGDATTLYVYEVVQAGTDQTFPILGGSYEVDVTAGEIIAGQYGAGAEAEPEDSKGNFGNETKIEISGYKWDDVNGDTNWDEPTEAGLNGWTIILDDDENPTNGTIKTATTQTLGMNDGYYTFGDIPLADIGDATTLYVYEVVQAGTDQTFPILGGSYEVDVTAGEIIAGQYGAGAEAEPEDSKGNFGNETKIEISGYKWDDVNGDTNWDEPTEAGLNGWTIILDDDENPTNGTIKTATTQTLGMNDGYYTFGDIPLADIGDATTLYVYEVVQAGTDQTFPILGGSYEVDVTAGEIIAGQYGAGAEAEPEDSKGNFGNETKIEISGYKWDDVNGDTNWDEPTEAGLNGWTIILDDDENPTNGTIKTATTQTLGMNDGYYSFGDIPLADIGDATTLYVYEVVQAGTDQTFPILGGSYEVDVTAGEIIAGQYGAGAEAEPEDSKGNFGNETKIEISGYKWDDVNGDTNWDEPTEAGLNGWTIILDDDENPTNGTIKTATTQTLGMNDGYYTFGDIPLADIGDATTLYVYEVVQAGTDQTFPILGGSYEVDVTAGEIIAGQYGAGAEAEPEDSKGNFGNETKIEISGYKWDDVNGDTNWDEPTEAGLNGWTIILDDDENPTNGTIKTATTQTLGMNDGYYSFGDIPLADIGDATTLYVYEVVQAGTDQTFPILGGSYEVDVTAGEIIAGQYGAGAEAEPEDSKGNFGNETKIEISGYKWDDVNGDTNWDEPTEAGLNGWTIILDDDENPTNGTIKTATTQTLGMNDGYYSFGDIPLADIGDATTLYVYEVVQAGTDQTFPILGGSYEVDVTAGEIIAGQYGAGAEAEPEDSKGNFGNETKIEISGYKWDDVNGDTNWDEPTEAGLNGWTIILDDDENPTNGTIKTATTQTLGMNDGYYTFGDIPLADIGDATTLYVYEVVQAGTDQTFPILGGSYEVDVTAGEIIAGQYGAGAEAEPEDSKGNFGNETKIEISGYKWDDVNGDTNWDEPTEAGLNGWTIILDDDENPTNGTIKTATTQTLGMNDGYYTFGDIPLADIGDATTLYVYEVVQAGTDQTFPILGGSYEVDVTAGEIIAGQYGAGAEAEPEDSKGNFGNETKIEISGYKWDDVNGDTNWDEPTEAGLNGWTIILDDDENPTNGTIKTATTQTLGMNDGYYSFGDIPLADIGDATTLYVYEVVQAGTDQTFPILGGSYEVDVTAGEIIAGQYGAGAEAEPEDSKGNFGNETKIEISGYKWDDVNGDTNWDEPTEAGLNGWTIILDDDENPTNGTIKTATTQTLGMNDGYYSFGDIPLADIGDATTLYVYEVVQAGTDQTFPILGGSYEVDVTAGEIIAGQYGAGAEAEPEDSKGNFGNETKIEISGYKWDDVNGDTNWDEPTEAGLNGWTIILDDDENPTNGTIKTATTQTLGMNDGYYSFGDIPLADIGDATTLYVYEVVQAGTDQTFPILGGSYEVDVTAGEIIAGQYGAGAEAEPEDSKGNFGNETKIEISGYKWDDVNGDTNWDEPTEAGLNGWTIILDDDENPTNGTIKTATTQTLGMNDGYYSFGDIPLADIGDATTLYVYEVVQAGTDQTFPILGGSYEVDVTAGEIIAGQYGAGAEAEPEDSKGNFGNETKIEISGYKWDDVNGDTNWDEPTEAGLNGWTIILDDDENPTNGTIKTATTQTLGMNDGYYTFGDIPLADIGDATTLYVYEVVQAGTDQTFPILGGSYEVDVTAGEIIAGQYGAGAEAEPEDSKGNFGNETKIEISGYKWDDVNGDTNWDEPTEAGLNGWTIILDDDENPTNGTIKTATTQTLGMNDGYYTFGDIPLADIGDATTLYVYEVVQAGTDQTFPILGGSYEVDVTAGEIIAGQYGAGAEAEPEDSKGNFGNETKIEISGYKWDDINGNGQWDEPTEAGRNGVTIVLDDDENPTNGTIDSDVTAFDGSTYDGFYSFEDISLADIGDAEFLYVYEVVTVGVDQTFPADGGSYQVDVASGEVIAGQYGAGAEADPAASKGNFGNYEPDPLFTIEKSVVDVDGGGPNGVVNAKGDVITYRLEITNEGIAQFNNDVDVADYFENAVGEIWDYDPDNPEAMMGWVGTDTNVNTISISGTGGEPDDGIFENGETLIIEYTRAVTADDLAEARDSTLDIIKVGAVWCLIEECTGDLDLDNTAKVFVDDEVVDADYAVVDVTCPSGAINRSGGPDGGSNAENVWQSWVDAQPQEMLT